MAKQLTKIVAKRLQLNIERDVARILLVGSWLWGSASTESDYDILVVTTASHVKNSRSLGKYHGRGIDAIILGQTEFDEAAKFDILFGAYACIEDSHPCLLWRNSTQQKRQAVYCNLSGEKKKQSAAKRQVKLGKDFAVNCKERATKDLLKAKKIVSKAAIRCTCCPFHRESIGADRDGDIQVIPKIMARRARKILAHAVRSVLLAYQLIDSGTITDFSGTSQRGTSHCIVDGKVNLLSSGWQIIHNRILSHTTGNGTTMSLSCFIDLEKEVRRWLSVAFRSKPFRDHLYFC